MNKPKNPNDILNDIMLTSQATIRVAESEIDDTIRSAAKKKTVRDGIKKPRKSDRRRSSSWLEAITGKEDRVENRTAAERVAMGPASASDCQEWENVCWTSDEEDACMNFNARCPDQFSNRKLGQMSHPRFWAVRTEADISAADAKYRGVANAAAAARATQMASIAAYNAAQAAKGFAYRCDYWRGSCAGDGGEYGSSDSDDCITHSRNCAAPAGYDLGTQTLGAGLGTARQVTDSNTQYSVESLSEDCTKNAACAGVSVNETGLAQMRSNATRPTSDAPVAGEITYIKNASKLAAIKAVEDADLARREAEADKVRLVVEAQAAERAKALAAEAPRRRAAQALGMNLATMNNRCNVWEESCLSSDDEGMCVAYNTHCGGDGKLGSGSRHVDSIPSGAGLALTGQQCVTTLTGDASKRCLRGATACVDGVCKHQTAADLAGAGASAAAQAARSWAAERVRLADEREKYNCEKSASDKRSQQVEPEAAMSEAAKTARYAMFRDLQNPILRNVIMNPSGDSIIAGEALGPATANQSGIGWLRIPTSNVNHLAGAWSRSEGIVNDPVDHITPNSFITFLIVRKYNAAESKDIFQVLKQGTEKDPAPKLSDGTGFIFTKEGHIRVWHKDDTSAKPIMYNPFINLPANTTGATDAVGRNDDRLVFSSKTDNTYTMKGDDHEQGVGKYSTWARGVRDGPLFAMSTKTVMNKTLNYILYTPDVEPSQTSTYYLLYNPIHGTEFKKFYQSLLQSDNPVGGGDGPESVTEAAVSFPHYSTGVRVYDEHKCLKSVLTPSYTKIIGKYCNAFKLEGQLTRGSTLTHYADPLCQIMMSSMGSQFYYAMQSNVTNESIRTKFYKNRNTDSRREGYEQYLMAKAALTGGTSEFSKMTWACRGHNVTGTDPNIQTYMEDTNLYDGSNPSFVQILGHSIVNANQSWRHGTASKVQSIGRRTAAEDADTDAFAPLTQPNCTNPNISITSCTTTIDLEGSMTNTNVVQQNFCGPQPGNQDKDPDDTTKSCTAGSSDCPPELEACQTAEGSTKYMDSYNRERYSECCYSEGAAGLLQECPVDDDGDKLVQSTYGAQNPGAPPARGVTKTKYLLAISNAVKKLEKAAKIADTSTTAYPVDPLITDGAEEVTDQVAAAKLVATSLTTRVDGIVASTSLADINAIAPDIDALVDDTDAAYKTANGLVILIANNYLFGFKKMYVIGGAVALVVLIILIIALKK